MALSPLAFEVNAQQNRTSSSFPPMFPSKVDLCYANIAKLLDFTQLSGKNLVHRTGSLSGSLALPQPSAQ